MDRRQSSTTTRTHSVERRSERDRRAARRAAVDLLINRFLDGHPYMCRMVDLSRSGLRLHPLLEPAGAPRFMGLQFQLPGTDQVITASGEAVTVATAAGPTTVGVRFTKLPSDSASALAAFLDQHGN